MYFQPLGPENISYTPVVFKKLTIASIIILYYTLGQTHQESVMIISPVSTDAP